MTLLPRHVWIFHGFFPSFFHSRVLKCLSYDPLSLVMLIHWGLPGLVVHWASVAPVDHFEARSLGVSNVGNPASPRRPQKGANALVESRPNSIRRMISFF